MILVDGHNLIGRWPGLSLSDEEGGRGEILRRLGAAKGSGRETVVVVFDGNRPGVAKEDRFGGLRIVYAPAGSTADAEILRRLGRGNPRAATVVTSDRGLGAKARGLGARVETCEAFRQGILKQAARAAEAEKPEAGPSEVEAWLAIFRERQEKRSRS